ncbi:MAG: sulfatase-like hydrolase/transferase [Myxococcales bacterium]|jgi:arylsulfatase A-like enzyme|nr:sulfatase-like hydrolase/transferase [Myxococcales bacterium]
MFRLILSAMVASALGLFCAGVVESLFVVETTRAVALGIKVGLLLPLLPLVTLGLLSLFALCPAAFDVAHILAALRHRQHPRLSARIFVVGVLGLLSLPVIYRIVLFFMTAFHHSGLAALFLSLSLSFLAVIGLLLGRRLVHGTEKKLERFSALRFGHRPVVALAFVVVAALSLLLPPLFRGIDATGPYAFIGLFRKDGLALAPLFSLAIAGGVAVAAWLGLRRLSVPILLSASLLALGMAAAGPPLAHAILSRDADALDTAERRDDLGTAMAKVLRKVGDADGDGHSRWLGGKDCDDTNPDVYPGAPEPANDCLTAGLDIALLQKQAAESETEQREVEVKRESFRPDFPDDLSVVLITVDSLRWNAPGFAGNTERQLTPNLDALVANGVVYERAYALSSYTGQAIPSMMTGKYPSELLRNDAYEVRISGRETFAAEYICGETVNCAAFLSHFLFSPHHGWHQGFQHWQLVPSTQTGPTSSPDTAYNSHFVSGEAIKWLKKSENVSGRFFLWAHYMDPHKEYLEHRGVTKFGNSRRDRYDHEVLYTDTQIGRLLEHLATLPNADRILYIVSADHGEAFGEHGRWTHGKELWEEIIRVPLAIAGPGISPRRIAESVSLIDLFATLLDAFGLPVPEGSHSVSRVPDWVAEAPILTRPVYVEQNATPLCEARRVFIHDGWKLHHLPDTGVYRLYPLTDDYERGESLVSSHPDDFARMRTAYEAFRTLRMKPVKAVRYFGGHVDKMPLPDTASK